MSDTPYQNQQQRYRQEDMMANGPVSRGASNKDAPMYTDEQTKASEGNETPSNQSKQPDYNKMEQSEASGPMEGTGMGTDQKLATPGGGTLPTAVNSGTPRGGMNTSSDTVSGGGTSPGSVVGGGLHRDRGSSPITDMDATRNVEDELDRVSRPSPNKIDQRAEGEQAIGEEQ
jgi:hypothetical protein